MHQLLDQAWPPRCAADGITSAHITTESLTVAGRKVNGAEFLLEWNPDASTTAQDDTTPTVGRLVMKKYVSLTSRDLTPAIKRATVLHFHRPQR